MLKSVAKSRSLTFLYNREDTTLSLTGQDDDDAVDDDPVDNLAVVDDETDLPTEDDLKRSYSSLPGRGRAFLDPK